MGHIEFDIHTDLKCVHFKGSGDISYDYLIEKIIEVNQHPDFRPGFCTFVDFGDAVVSAKKGGFHSYQEFFKQLQTTGRVAKWAIYSKNHETFKNANMAHLLISDTIEVDVFEIRQDALSYLNIDKAQMHRFL